jgi:hypothetical protein
MNRKLYSFALTLVLVPALLLGLASCSDPVETSDDLPEVPEHVSRRSKG